MIDLDVKLRSMIDSQLILCIAARACVCAPTARKALEGKPVKGMAGARVARALQELGITPGAPGTTPSVRTSPFDGSPSPLGLSSLGWNGGPR